MADLRRQVHIKALMAHRYHYQKRGISTVEALGCTQCLLIMLCRNSFQMYYAYVCKI